MTINETPEEVPDHPTSSPSLEPMTDIKLIFDFCAEAWKEESRKNLFLRLRALWIQQLFGFE